MLEPGYLKYVLIAVVAAFSFAGYASLRGEIVDYYMVASSTVFGVVFMSLAVVKLPVFRNYYICNIYVCNNYVRNRHGGRTSSFNPACHGYENQKAAPVMSSLVSGSVFALVLYLIGINNLVIPGFCAGIAAGVTSFYHAPRMAS